MSWSLFLFKKFYENTEKRDLIVFFLFHILICYRQDNWSDDLVFYNSVNSIYANSGCDKEVTMKNSLHWSIINWYSLSNGMMKQWKWCYRHEPKPSSSKIQNWDYFWLFGIEVLQPSQLTGVMSSQVSLSNHTSTGQV